MLNSLAEYFYDILKKIEKPQTYGSALEMYIMSHNPQNGCDIDRLQRQFDQLQYNKRNSGWMP